MGRDEKIRKGKIFAVTKGKMEIPAPADEPFADHFATREELFKDGATGTGMGQGMGGGCGKSGRGIDFGNSHARLGVLRLDHPWKGNIGARRRGAVRRGDGNMAGDGDAQGIAIGPEPALVAVGVHLVHGVAWAKPIRNTL